MNLPFLATGQIWHSFDFSTHVFFASHYQRAWWSLWEPRWFAGFDVASYPPLTHQLSALLGWLVGIENAVNVLTTVCVLAFPAAVYVLVRQCVGREAAARAAALAVVTPSVYLAGYAFGQLPTLFALDASLLAAAALVAYLRRGGARRLATLVALGGVVVAAHHATMLFFLGPLFATVALAEWLRVRDAVHRKGAEGDENEKRKTKRCSAADECWNPAPVSRPAPFRFSFFVFPPVLAWRVAFAAIGTSLAALLVILPFWVWHATEYVIQVPIDHQSRHNFLQDTIALDLFFWAEHGVLVAALVLSPLLLRRRARSLAPWYALGWLLLILGLGGTTPLPRWLLGAQWDWLTYDRFSLWADVPLLVLLGTLASDRLGARAAAPGATRRPSRFGLAWSLTLAWLGVFAVVDALVPALVQSEPVPIDPRPIVAFLDSHDRDGSGGPPWRYLTLGFGEQAGLVHARADAGTVDGYYYTARRLPLLTGSGIASLDFSLLWDPRAQALRALLANPGPFSLRWVFTRDPSYAAIVAASGWEKGATLDNGVTVWVAPRAIPPALPPPDRRGLLAVWWGVAPLASLVAAGLLGGWAWRARPGREGAAG